MSQLFDSLRHAGQRHADPPSRPTARGDAVLASLGYGRPAKAQRKWRPVVGVLTVVLVVLAWFGWRLVAGAEELQSTFSRSPSAATSQPSTYR